MADPLPRPRKPRLRPVEAEGPSRWKAGRPRAGEGLQPAGAGTGWEPGGQGGEGKWPGWGGWEDARSETRSTHGEHRARVQGAESNQSPKSPTGGAQEEPRGVKTGAGHEDPEGPLASRVPAQSPLQLPPARPAQPPSPGTEPLLPAPRSVGAAGGLRGLLLGHPGAGPGQGGVPLTEAIACITEPAI